ncbi:hypothetical protein cypCar_00035853, partial [Cyprinus carpio]
LKDPDPNPGVVISVLATIGELAQVSGLEMRKWMDELFPIIMDMLQDSSSLAKRQAIRVLGLLGALDPYKHKVNIGMIDQSRDASAVSLSESKSSQDS